MKVIFLRIITRIKSRKLYQSMIIFDFGFIFNVYVINSQIYRLIDWAHIIVYSSITNCTIALGWAKLEIIVFRIETTYVIIGRTNARSCCVWCTDIASIHRIIWQSEVYVYIKSKVVIGLLFLFERNMVENECIVFSKLTFNIDHLHEHVRPT